MKNQILSKRIFSFFPTKKMPVITSNIIFPLFKLQLQKIIDICSCEPDPPGQNCGKVYCGKPRGTTNQSVIGSFKLLQIAAS